jgi:hypothetical protein
MAKFQIFFYFMFFMNLSGMSQTYFIPQWFSEIPILGERTAIGVSDPRMSNDSMGKVQAETRAKAMLALFRNVHIACTSDHFISEIEAHRTYIKQERIEKLVRFSARLPYHPSDFVDNAQFQNENSEHFCLMSYQDIGDVKPNVINVSIELYLKIYETSHTRRLTEIEVLEMKIVDSIGTSFKEYQYQYRNADNRCIMRSYDDFVEYLPPTYVYSYQDMFEHINYNQFDISENLEKGVWQALLRGTLAAMNEYSRNYDMRIKQVGDNYFDKNELGDIETDESQQKLFRQIVKNDMNFYLNELVVHNNALYINISSPLLNENMPVITELTPTESQRKEDCHRSFWDKLFGRKKYQ